MKHKLFTIVKSHQFRRNYYSTTVSLTCSKMNQRILEILAILEPRLATFLMNESKPGFSSFRECWPHHVPKSCCMRLSFFLITMTHKSRTNLEIAVERDPPLGRNNFPCLSVVGMVLFVFMCTGLGETLTESASRFLVLESEAASVPWMLVFDCAKQGSLFFRDIMFRE